MTTGSPLTRIALRREAVDRGNIRQIAFRETEAYLIGSRFFADPQRYIERLLSERETET